jgi:acetyltransferase-like isoleucine patch superfamily enzyme
MRRLRAWYWRMLGVKLGGPCWLQDIWIPQNPWDVQIDENVALDRHVVLLAVGNSSQDPKIVIGAGTYINRFTIIDATLSVRIGRNCMIGPQCYLTDHDHGRSKGDLISKQDLLSSALQIGDDVWIGAGAIVLSGVSIGDGAVIGAGAVVTRNVGPFVVVAGVPAREISKRT